MQGFGANVEARNAYGVYGGLPYSAEALPDAPSPKIVFFFILHGAGRIRASVLKTHRHKYIRWFQNPLDNECLLTVFITVPSEFYLKSTISDVFRLTGQIAAEAGLTAPNTCPLCNMQNCDTYALLNGSFRLTHATCLNTRLTLPENDVTTKATVKGRVITGILGSLLGAFIGALPIWALALSRGRLYWALYVFIPILSGLCYRLCRGKANANIAGISVLFSSLLSAFALEQVWYWMLLMVKFPGNWSFLVSIPRYFITHTLGSTISEMILNLLALLVGFIATTVFLRRYAAEGNVPPRTIRGTAYIRKTAMPVKQEETT